MDPGFKSLEQYTEYFFLTLLFLSLVNTCSNESFCLLFLSDSRGLKWDFHPKLSYFVRFHLLIFSNERATTEAETKIN